MKPPLSKLRPELVDMAREAREALAVDVFDRDKVRAAMMAEARKGFTFLVVKVPLPVNLCETPAAITLQDWLRAEKIEARWQARPDVGEAAAIGGTGFELLVKWDATGER